MKLHILAIGAHPDDVELGCSGTIIKHTLKGQKVGVLDLTQGELGSRGTVETRYQEAAIAAQIMGISVRENLKLDDGFFENNKATRLKIIEVIRRFQPDIVLGNASTDRHPDHGNAFKLIEDACFLSGLVKVTTHSTIDNTPQTAWRPARVLHYIQDRFIEPDIVVDISAVMDEKLKAIEAYGTQFFNNNEPNSNEPETYISQSGFLESIIARARLMGHRISTKYGEGFTCQAQLGIADLDSLHLGRLV